MSATTHTAKPSDMDGGYLLRLALQLYGRPGAVSRELHDRTFELIAELEKRLDVSADLLAALKRIQAGYNNDQVGLTSGDMLTVDAAIAKAEAAQPAVATSEAK